MTANPQESAYEQPFNTGIWLYLFLLVIGCVAEVAVWDFG